MYCIVNLFGIALWLDVINIKLEKMSKIKLFLILGFIVYLINNIKSFLNYHQAFN